MSFLYRPLVEVTASARCWDVPAYEVDVHVIATLLNLLNLLSFSRHTWLQLLRFSLPRRLLYIYNCIHAVPKTYVVFSKPLIVAARAFGLFCDCDLIHWCVKWQTSFLQQFQLQMQWQMACQVLSSSETQQGCSYTHIHHRASRSQQIICQSHLPLALWTFAIGLSI